MHKKNKNIPALIIEDIDMFFTYWVLLVLGFMGSSKVGSVLRAYFMKLIGFKIGKNVKIMNGIVINKISDPIFIDDETFVNKNVYFDANVPIKIGKYCEIGFNTVFSTSKHNLVSDYKNRRHFVESKPIVVEDFVWIGCNSIILQGVTIGQGSVVAAGSIVISDVPPKTLVGGNPAKIIKSLSAE